MTATSETSTPLAALLAEVRSCRVCEAHLPLGPRPVLRVASEARVLITGQAPGTRVHASGLPWDDRSGDRLRDWLGLDRERFYGDPRIAILPMGLCYPGRGRGGDLPPRPECAPLWHERLRAQLPELRLHLLVGRYAHRYYLDTGNESLDATVRRWREYLSRGFFPAPHPSFRNTAWLKRRPWFEAEVVPALREAVSTSWDTLLR